MFHKNIYQWLFFFIFVLFIQVSWQMEEFKDDFFLFTIKQKKILIRFKYISIRFNWYFLSITFKLASFFYIFEVQHSCSI